MFELTLNSTVAIGVLVIVGYCLSSWRILGKGFENIFSDYVFYVALPVEIFLTILKSAHDHSATISAYTQAYCVGIGFLWLVIFCIYKLILKKTTIEVGLNFIALGQTNTAFLAVPIFISVLGSSALVIPIIVVQSIVLTTLSVFIIELSSLSKSAIWKCRLVRSVLIAVKNPLVISALAGYAASRLDALSRVDSGLFIFQSMAMIANTAAPLALLALGASFHVGDIKTALMAGRNEIILGITIKNLVHPIISFVVGRYFFALTDLSLFAIVLISSMPSPKNTFIFAQAYRVSVQKFNLILLGTTAASFLIVNVICIIFQYG